jgi:hypothetical protein
MKLLFGQYPSIHDYEMMCFFVLLNITVVKKYSEGFNFLMFASPTTYLISASMYVTWLARFSGNANLFYFEVVVAATFETMFIISSLHAIDAKRKKYSKELLNYKKTQ